jgi:hypothetical protein
MYHFGRCIFLNTKEVLMKKSKLSLLALTAISVAQAETNSFTIKVDDNLTIEVFAVSDGNDKNIIRQLAHSCGDENFEMGMQLRIKPFAVNKDTIAAEAEEAYNENLRELLFSKDENGKTALDLVKEREKATGCKDCTLMRESIQNLMREILKAEYTKNAKKIEV